MSAKAKRHADHEEEEHENEERWLVSFADMMTLMFALFMVLFSISSVNTSKFEALKHSLQDSFSPAALPGGTSIRDQGGAMAQAQQGTPAPLAPPVMPRQAVAAQLDKSTKESDAASAEEASFRRLKQQVDATATKLGLQDKVSTVIRKRGLVIRLLTDGVLFDSGRAELKPRGDHVLAPLGTLLRNEDGHPVVVEGFTDTVPITSALYPTNWELSGARAARVVRRFVRAGVPVDRLTGAAYAWRHPIASNATPEGRSRNRRVEIVLTRRNRPITEGTP